MICLGKIWKSISERETHKRLVYLPAHQPPVEHRSTSPHAQATWECPFVGGYACSYAFIHDLPDAHELVVSNKLQETTLEERSFYLVIDVLVCVSKGFLRTR